MENFAKSLIGNSIFIAYLTVVFIIDGFLEYFFHIDVRNSFIFYIFMVIIIVGLLHGAFLGQLMKMDMSFEAANKVIFQKIIKYFRKIWSFFSGEKDLDN